MNESGKLRQMRSFDTYQDLAMYGSITEKENPLLTVKDLGSIPKALVCIGFDIIKSADDKYYVIEINGVNSGLSGLGQVLKQDPNWKWLHAHGSNFFCA